MTPFALTYGHDAVLPMEITVLYLRVAHQKNLTPGDYNEATGLGSSKGSEDENS